MTAGYDQFIEEICMIICKREIELRGQKYYFIRYYEKSFGDVYFDINIFIIF